ncbi:Protein of unknown function [Catalinimonas alkaloidigena]|uniref:DinB superfamily protein n=1 Tax=Catalinimonas alkaloidigena TaxID=1075417 RepID=A0A1G8XRC5_9BACT|nr:DinB family protein [Catalinimonas alkaloidigena]SDJ92986.1 Protein of unknown function [Catalinimonas alkaloidigena]
MIAALHEFFRRGLDQLREEIGAYPDENFIWRKLPGTTNSAGNLTLHLLGNLNHFVGQGLGKTGYQREREREFTEQDVSRELLLQRIQSTLDMMEEVCLDLEEEQLPYAYPEEHNAGQDQSIGFMMARLLAHFHYHLGQINYHRRYFVAA